MTAIYLPNDAPPRVVCSGCGKRTAEASFAINEDFGPDGLVRTLEVAAPLCPACTAAAKVQS